MAAGRITFVEIEAFGRLRGLTFKDWELDTLVVMDRAWARVSAAKQKAEDAANNPSETARETGKLSGPRMIPATKENMLAGLRLASKTWKVVKDG